MVRAAILLAAISLVHADTLVAGGKFTDIGPFKVPSLAKFNGWFWDTAFTKTALATGSQVTAGCKSGSVFVFGGNMTAPGARSMHFLRTSTWYFAGFDDAFFVPPSTLRPTTYGQVFNGDGGEEEAGLFDGLELDFGEIEFDGGDGGSGDEPDEPVEPVEPVEASVLASSNLAHTALGPESRTDEGFGASRLLDESILASSNARFMADLTGSPGSFFCVGGSVLIAGPFSNATAQQGITDDDAVPLQAFPFDDDTNVAGDVGAVGVWSPKRQGFVLLGDPGQVSGMSHAVVGPDVHTVYAGGFFDGPVSSTGGFIFPVPTSVHLRYFSLSSLAIFTSSDGWQSMGGGAMLPGDNGTLGTQGEVFGLSLYNDTGRVFVGGHCTMCRYYEEQRQTRAGPINVNVPEQCFSYIGVWEGAGWVGDADFGATLQGAVTALRYDHWADVLHVGGLFRWCAGGECAASAASMAKLGDYLDVQWAIPAANDVVPCGFVSSVARLSNHTAVGGALKLVSAAQCAPVMLKLQTLMNHTRGTSKAEWTTIAADILDSDLEQAPFCGVAWVPTDAGATSGEWGCAGSTDGPVYTMYAYPDVGPKGFTVALIVCLSLLACVLGCGALCWGGGTLYYIACKMDRKNSAAKTKKASAANIAKQSKSVSGSKPAPKTGASAPAASDSKRAATGAQPAAAAAKNRTTVSTVHETMAWGGFHQELLLLAKWWAIASAAMAVFDLCVVLPVSATLGAGELDGIGSLFTKRQWIPNLYVDVSIGMSLALPSLVFLALMVAAHAAKMYPDPAPSPWLKNMINKAAPVPILGTLKHWTLKNDVPVSMQQLGVMHSVFASRIAPTVTIVLVTSIWAAIFTAAAFLAPMPLAIVQLSPAWGSFVYSFGLVAVAKVCDLLITYFHAPVMTAKSTLLLRLVLRACLSLAQSSLIALNPSVKLSSLLTPLFSAAADFILLAGLKMLYQRFPSQDHLKHAELGSKIGLMEKLAIVVGYDAANPIATWNLAAENRVVRLCGFIIDFFLLGGYTLVFQLQLSILFSLDYFAFVNIADTCTNPILRSHQLESGTLPAAVSVDPRQRSVNGDKEAQLSLLGNAASGAAIPHALPPSSGGPAGDTSGSPAAPIPGSCKLQTAASHSSLYGKDVRSVHVLVALLALALSGFASPGSFVSVGGQAWVPPATAAMALTLLGMRQAVSTFFDAPPKLLEKGLILTVLFFVLSWATLDGFALTVSYAHAFSITATAPLIAFTVVFHGVILVTVFSLWCCTPKKATPLSTRRMVTCGSLRCVDPQHALFRYTRSRKPLVSCLRSK